MNRFRIALAVVVALLVPAAIASAGTATQSWNVCGGSYQGYSGFGLCAAVTVTVTPSTTTPGQYTVTLKIYNMSGSNGSYAGSVFRVVGLDNIGNPAYVPGSLSVKGWCPDASGNLVACDVTNYWQVAVDKNFTSIKVDDAVTTTNGVNYSAISSCGHPAYDPANSRVMVTDCAGTGAAYVTMSFDVTSAFDPTLASLYIKAQNGYNGASTWCDSTDPTMPCTTITPEPHTLTLLATGLVAFGGVGIARRRRRDEETPDT